VEAAAADGLGGVADRRLGAALTASLPLADRRLHHLIPGVG
jgi:hypothetical protein